MLSSPRMPPGFRTRFVKVAGSDIRNSHNITLTNNDSLTEIENTTWSLPGAVVGFLSWLCALVIPMLIYGSNALLFFICTWPFFLVLVSIAVVVGIALRSLMNGKLRYSIVFTPATVGIVFGALFMWLLG